MDLKLSFYKSIGAIAKSSTIFASNTSSLPITQMGVASGRPSQFVGLHFFNPVQLMKLLEVVRTDATSPEVFDLVTRFGQSIGKTTVSCKDTPGFIVNRLLVPYIAQVYCRHHYYVYMSVIMIISCDNNRLYLW
jgi:3-hydroxyacyl-CoA dehydrogenase